MLLFYVLLGTVSILVGVLAAGVLVYTYWIEILLLYQTCQRKGETLGGKAALCCPLTSSPSPETWGGHQDGK